MCDILDTPCLDVKSVRMLTKKGTGAPKGCAFVELSDRESHWVLGGIEPLPKPLLSNSTYCLPIWLSLGLS